jgi:hypothetical protein
VYPDDTIPTNTPLTESAEVTAAHASGELKLLRYELLELSKDQQADRDRIATLETEAIAFKSKISVGKGILYGVLFASGGLGLVLVDKLKNLKSLIE